MLTEFQFSFCRSRLFVHCNGSLEFARLRMPCHLSARFLTSVCMLRQGAVIPSCFCLAYVQVRYVGDWPTGHSYRHGARYFVLPQMARLFSSSAGGHMVDCLGCSKKE